MNHTQNTGEPLVIGFFITPHGFGHAARAAAIMEAIRFLQPAVRFEIFTAVPPFFFQESLPTEYFNYNEMVTDIGMAQKSPLQVDLRETLRRLDQFLPFRSDLISALAATVKEKKCRFIVSEIAPMGIAVAKAAGIPSVLVENFTWDWIYEEYQREYPEFQKHVRYLRDLFDSADYRIRAEPAFPPHDGDLTAPPISRQTRTAPETIREQLKIPSDAKMVMITMGGISSRFDFLRQLFEFKKVWFVVPGSHPYKYEKNVIQLPHHHCGFYHPDLINACDAVLGKPGYSTVAEIYQAGVPFCYVPRHNFRESAVLEQFIQEKMSGFPVSEDAFATGDWLSRLPELLAIPRIKRTGKPGASLAANFLLKRFQ